LHEENMGQRRYTVEFEKIAESLIEEVVESVGLETEEATRARERAARGTSVDHQSHPA
jgi:hypothetical protein